MAVISPLYFAILATVFAGTTVDYCNIKTCKNKRIHTICKYTSSIPARACGQLYSVGLNDADRKVITNKHNELRQKVASGNEKRGKPGPQPPAVRMPNLIWDNELEKIAQRWASQCKWDHDDCRNVERYAVGQNIAKASSTGENTFTLSGMIESQWYDEVKNFSRNGVSSYIFDGKKTGHYTQIVWAKTVKIGCGLINFKNSSLNTKYLVCNYGPSGNVPNMKIYEEK